MQDIWLAPFGRDKDKHRGFGHVTFADAATAAAALDAKKVALGGGRLRTLPAPATPPPQRRATRTSGGGGGSGGGSKHTVRRALVVSILEASRACYAAREEGDGPSTVSRRGGDDNAAAEHADGKPPALSGAEAASRVRIGLERLESEFGGPRGLKE